MRIDVISIFPQFFDALGLSLFGKATDSGLLGFSAHDLREWATDRHRSVDDTPAGGGAGMVMKADVWGRALDEVFAEPVTPGAVLADSSEDVSVAAFDMVSGTDSLDGTETVSETATGSGGRAPRRVLVIPTPSGETFTQRVAEDLAHADHLVFACGRYEGIDSRVAEHYRESDVEVRELSIGDYVLNGGEVASIVMIEAVVRLIPGFMGNPESLVEESHGAAGLLEYPVYTRPANWNERDIPQILMSGHHANIARWRRERAFDKTMARRPDMIEALKPEQLDKKDRAYLQAAGWRRQPNGNYLRPLEGE